MGKYTNKIKIGFILASLSTVLFFYNNMTLANADNYNLIFEGYLEDIDTKVPINKELNGSIDILVKPPDSSCVLYRYTYSKSPPVIVKNGSFNLNLSFPISIFKNNSAFSQCSPSYLPKEQDSRTLFIYINDPDLGEGFPPLKIELNPIPYAINAFSSENAQKLNGVSAGSYLRLSGASNIPETSLPTLADWDKLLNFSKAGALTGSINSTLQMGAGQLFNLGTFGGNPSGTSTGSLWLDSTNRLVKYYDGSTVRSLATVQIDTNGVDSTTSNSQWALNGSTYRLKLAYPKASELKKSDGSSSALPGSACSSGSVLNWNSGGYFECTALTFSNISTNKIDFAGSGNIGIGTSTPTSKLEVNGDIKSFGNVLIAGALSSNGNISSVTGNISGKDLTATGSISANGNISSTNGNLSVKGINATGITATGVTVNGNLAATGTLSSGSISSTGTISSAGSISATNANISSYNSTANTSANIDWSKGNVQTITVNCTADTNYNLLNMKPGIIYKLISKSPDTGCKFTCGDASCTKIYSSGGTAFDKNNTFIFTLILEGTDVYISWSKFTFNPPDGGLL